MLNDEFILSQLLWKRTSVPLARGLFRFREPMDYCPRKYAMSNRRRSKPIRVRRAGGKVEEAGLWQDKNHSHRGVQAVQRVKESEAG